MGEDASMGDRCQATHARIPWRDVTRSVCDGPFRESRKANIALSALGH